MVVAMLMVELMVMKVVMMLPRVPISHADEAGMMDRVQVRDDHARIAELDWGLQEMLGEFVYLRNRQIHCRWTCRCTPRHASQLSIQ